LTLADAEAGPHHKAFSKQWEMPPGRNHRGVRRSGKRKARRALTPDFPLNFQTTGKGASNRHCVAPAGRANARPMKGSATKQSILFFARRDGLLRSARNDGAMLQWPF
jgi:hypothetical protein